MFISLTLAEKKQKIFEKCQKSILTIFWVYAAPESWSKYTAFRYYLVWNKFLQLSVPCFRFYTFRLQGHEKNQNKTFSTKWKVSKRKIKTKTKQKMLRNRIRQTSGIKILTNTLTNRSGKVKSGYVAVFCFISTFIILYKHFKDLEPLEEIVGDVPSWWSLSPLWSQDGLLHVNPHPYRYHC